MLKVEELTKEQLIAEYNLLRTESEAEVTSLRGKNDSRPYAQNHFSHPARLNQVVRYEQLT